jgi:hypothetical protein
MKMTEEIILVMKVKPNCKILARAPGSARVLLSGTNGPIMSLTNRILIFCITTSNMEADPGRKY